jgi:HSP20 family protein
MALIRWNPVGNLAALEVDSLNRMFDAAFGGEALVRHGWIPPVDIFETATQDVVVKLELPEMKREDIKITFEDQVLSIEGTRELDAKIDAERYHRVERGHGTFHRSFTLPATVDGTRINAAYTDGVLTITLPRREDTRPRQIPIGG